MRIVVKLHRIGLMLTHEFDGDRECARHIFILGEFIVVAVQVIVQGTGLEHLRLERDADGNLLLLAQFQDPVFTWNVVLVARPRRLLRTGGTQPTTLSALRQATACGAGAGGS